MNQVKIRSRTALLILLAAAGIIGVLAYSSLQLNTPFQTSDKQIVATTFFPIADITRNIAGEKMDVLQLLPSGASPHTYTPTPGQIAQLQRAEALFTIGHGLDDWAANAAARSTDIDIITVDEGIELKNFGGEYTLGEEEHDHEARELEATGEAGESADPHYWLSVPNAKRIAQSIANELSRIDPNNVAYYTSQLEQYQTQLDELENDLQTQAASARQRKFIAIHNAWSYFAAQYGFELVATYEPIEGKQPSAPDIKHLQEIISANNIITFYTEPQKQTASAIRFIEDDLNLTISTLDPVGGVDEADSYINLMRTNMNALTGN